MSDLQNFTGLTEQQLAAATSFSMPLLEGVSNAFGAQADCLQRVEILTAEFLQRRRAGCAAAQHLVERLRLAREPSEVLKAQQEWLTGATRRVVADATCWQSAGLVLLNEMSRWWLQTAPVVVSQEPVSRRATKIDA
jgi:hypothetical protein